MTPREQRQAQRAERKAKALELLRTLPTRAVHEATGVSMETLRWWRFCADIKPVHREQAAKP